MFNPFLRMNLQLFAEDGGADLGGGGAGDSGASGSGDTGAGGSNGGTGEGAGTGGTVDKTFTQADIDRIVGERLGREKATYSRERDALIKDIFGDQGINSYDQYQQAVERAQQQQQQQQFQQAGIDPNLINQLLEQHPDIQFAKQMRAQQQEDNNFQQQADEFWDAFPDVKAEDIPPEVWQLREQRGISLLDAYLRHQRQGMDVNKLKDEAVKEYLQGKRKAPGFTEGTGATPVVQTTQPKTFEDARKNALAMLKAAQENKS